MLRWHQKGLLDPSCITTCVHNFKYVNIVIFVGRSWLWKHVSYTERKARGRLRLYLVFVRQSQIRYIHSNRMKHCWVPLSVADDNASKLTVSTEYSGNNHVPPWSLRPQLKIFTWYHSVNHTKGETSLDIHLVSILGHIPFQVCATSSNTPS